MSIAWFSLLVPSPSFVVTGWSVSLSLSSSCGSKYHHFHHFIMAGSSEVVSEASSKNSLSSLFHYNIIGWLKWNISVGCFRWEIGVLYFHRDLNLQYIYIFFCCSIGGAWKMTVIGLCPFAHHLHWITANTFVNVFFLGSNRRSNFLWRTRVNSFDKLRKKD